MVAGRNIAIACAAFALAAAAALGQPERPLGGAADVAGPAAADERSPSGPGAGVGPADLVDWAGQTLLPLLVVVTLIVLVALALRKLSGMGGGLGAAMGPAGRAPSGVLSVLARYPLPGGQTLVLLRIDRRVLLVAQSAGSPFRGRAGSMRTLCEITDPEEVSSLLQRTQDEQGESMAARFRSLLGRYERQHDDGPFEAPQMIDTSGHGHAIDVWDEAPAPPATPETAARADAVHSLRSRLHTLRESGGGAA